jgi:hypothetical protein
MFFFWAVTPCRLVGKYQRFGETYVSIFRAELTSEMTEATSSLKMAEVLSPERWHLSTSLHGAKTQNNIMNCYT